MRSQTLCTVPVILVTDEMMDRSITLHEWTRRMAVLIRDTHLAMFMLGCGGYNGLQQDGVITLESTLREQYDYLRNFAQEIIDLNQGGCSAARKYVHSQISA